MEIKNPSIFFCMQETQNYFPKCFPSVFAEIGYLLVLLHNIFLNYFKSTTHICSCKGLKYKFTLS